MNESPVYVSLEFTPNPNTLKYSVNRQLLQRGAINIENREEAPEKSPLATKLFEIEGISAVMIGRDFVTVTKAESGDWDAVHDKTSKTIDEHLTNELPVVDQALLEKLKADSQFSSSPEIAEIEKKICEILDNEIRPAVAQDGGDIAFERFEDGIVYLYLQGSCAGCPSATATLKMGIETRLKKEIPEVKEVTSVA